MKLLAELNALITGPVPSIAYGLPRVIQVSRRPDPSINAVIHTIKVAGDISVAVTDETLMEDEYGDITVPIVRQAALQLAKRIKDELDNYIWEMEHEGSADPDRG